MVIGVDVVSTLAVICRCSDRSVKAMGGLGILEKENVCVVASGVGKGEKDWDGEN
jgi:hypothetical protein